MRTRLDMRYGLLTVVYLVGIFWLSAIPDLSGPELDARVQLLLNLGHAPLFAGLAFCLLRSTADTADPSSARYTLAFAASAACAVLDEWHQSFVPGRHSSTGDLLVDVAGIGGMLLLLRLHAARRDRRRPVTAAVCCVRQP
jgi:VanZ family protein